ncbi:MAG: ABC transporter ATP-binding protein [Burkholderiales bacterium]|nr:ABC transporter ATP-binding protein [Burkholderiales bacterium]
MGALLAVEGLELAYGDVAACRDISFEVAAGEIVTLIGANGAGKSTTLRGVAGAMRPRRGRILFRGEDVTRMRSHERLLAGIALVPEGRRVFPFLSVRENLEMGGFRHRGDKAKVNALIERMMDTFPRLRERAGQRAGTLSGGEQQMLALSRALMSEPVLLCLDEPSLGLAPIIVQEIFRSIVAINRAGTSVLLVEQNARYALETAHRGYVMQTGTIIAHDTCAALKQDERVKEAYLGRK